MFFRHWLGKDRLPPIALQLFGMVGFAGISIFWAITDRLSPALLAIAGSLIGFGTYVEAAKYLPDVKIEPHHEQQNGGLSHGE